MIPIRNRALHLMSMLRNSNISKTNTVLYRKNISYSRTGVFFRTFSSFNQTQRNAQSISEKPATIQKTEHNSIIKNDSITMDDVDISHERLMEAIHSNANIEELELIKDIDPEVLSLYKIGLRKDKLVFPCFDADPERWFEDGCEMKVVELNHLNSRVTPNSRSAIFGLPAFKKSMTEHDNGKTLIVVGDEISALRAHMISNLPVTILRTTDTGGIFLPGTLSQRLEMFDEIYFWIEDKRLLSNDGVVTAPDYFFFKKFIREEQLEQLMANNIKVVPIDITLTNNQMSWKEVQDRCRGMSHPDIQTVGTLFDILLEELLNPPPCGAQAKDFPKFCQLIKGLRPGELTVVTGPTGSGKTTFLSQFSLQFAGKDYYQGQEPVKTLWGSFEIQRTTLLRLMLHQTSKMFPFDAEGEHHLAGDNVNTHLTSNNALLPIGHLEHASLHLRKMPLFFMSYFGSENLSTILRTMKFSVYMYGIQHIILDNLQFMLSDTMMSNQTYDKYLEMDRAIHLLRKFATAHGVHVTLVIHPRKENVNEPLTLSSFYGSGKATQEADNVWILQRHTDNSKRIEVCKNRFDGTLGEITLGFDEVHRCFVEKEKEEEREGAGTNTKASGTFNCKLKSQKSPQRQS